MALEFDDLHGQVTWSIIFLPSGQHAIGYHWVYKIKQRANDTIECHKVRVVAKGFHLQLGLNYSDAFSLMVKHTTVRLVQLGWPI